MPFGEAIPLLRGLGFAARRRKHVLPHLTSDARKHLPNTNKSSSDVDTKIEVDVLEADRDPFCGRVGTTVQGSNGVNDLYQLQIGQ